MRQVRDWQCPHPNCLYVQKNGRKPDFRRHVQTHLRNNNDPTWICCGKPVGPNDPRWDSAREWNGYRMFGGCWQTFSRRDALKRHLKNANNSCIGEMDGHWMPKHCRK
ncbi:hypothetical protein K474DRAFT_1602299 [Panus rudis PR-1116 ss-1]|nr:hypothetical protein K474DRAFT_1602299 [Panus rudis PR-1116 ss-1]